jgi:hypothetical protein
VDASTKQTEPVSEMAALFAEERVGKFTVKPWTIRQLVTLSPILTSILEGFRNKGIDLSGVDIESIDLGKSITVEQMTGYIVDGLDIIGPAIPELISLSVGIGVQEAGELEWGEALAVTSKILSLNWDHVKNWWGLILGKLKPTLSRNQAPTTNNTL